MPVTGSIMTSLDRLLYDYFMTTLYVKTCPKCCSKTGHEVIFQMESLGGWAEGSDSWGAGLCLAGFSLVGVEFMVQGLGFLLCLSNNSMTCN